MCTIEFISLTLIAVVEDDHEPHCISDCANKKLKRPLQNNEGLTDASV